MHTGCIKSPTFNNAQLEIINGLLKRHEISSRGNLAGHFRVGHWPLATEISLKSVINDMDQLALISNKVIDTQ
jgi:hypothetical protein